MVLAAGFGSRLADHTGEQRLKPLTPVAGKPLILRTLASLAVAGCRQAVLVTGFNADVFEEQVREVYGGPLELTFVRNERFRLKNGLSVLAARPAVQAALAESFLLTMADHVFGDSVMRLAGSHGPPTEGATLLVDAKIDSIFDMDDATKVWAEDGRVASIGKEIARYNCIDTGVFVCTDALMRAIDDVYRRDGDASLSDGVQALSRLGRMHVLDIGDGFWQDVDTPEMLAHAEARLGDPGLRG